MAVREPKYEGILHVDFSPHLAMNLLEPGVLASSSSHLQAELEETHGFIFWDLFLFFSSFFHLLFVQYTIITTRETAMTHWLIVLNPKLVEYKRNNKPEKKALFIHKPHKFQNKDHIKFCHRATAAKNLTVII